VSIPKGGNTALERQEQQGRKQENASPIQNTNHPSSSAARSKGHKMMDHITSQA